MDDLPRREPEINKLFRLARKFGASDLELSADSAPRVKLRGVIRRMDMPVLSQADLEKLLPPLLYPEQARQVQRGERVSFLYACDEGIVHHVRVSAYGGQLRLDAHLLA